MSGLIIMGLIAAIAMSVQTGSSLNKKEVTNKETERPANLQITVIKDSSCLNCFSLDNLIQNIKKESVKITKETTLKHDSVEAKNLIAKHTIDRLPALIIDGEVEKTTALKKIWENLGQNSSTTFILRRTGYPYMEVSTGKIRGLVNITLLDDKSCTECYDVTEHLSILANFGFPISSSTSIDKSSTKAKELITKYKLTKLPTVILTGDISAYTGFDKVWSQVGTVETDKTYVFRDGLTAMNVTYKDLTLNKIIKASTSTSSS